jgi:uncharacterized protein (TIGR03118 family)
MERQHPDARLRANAIRPRLEALESRWTPQATAYLQHNLVSDVPGMAQIVDANLTNAWGLAVNPTGGAFWVASNGGGVSTQYTGDVRGSAIQANSLVVQIQNGSPTGIVANNSATDFLIQTSLLPAKFIFATENGAISAWNPDLPGPGLSNQAVQIAKVPDAVFKGLALATTANGSFLYATDFHHGTVDVFDSTFTKVNLSGSFTDPALPKGFAPFGIQYINGQIFVTYALQDAQMHDDVAGPGNGFIDVFDTQGNLIQKFAARGTLNSPWGMVIAPATFGEMGGDLLVGNFGDGSISVFDSGNAKFVDSLRDGNGAVIKINGLWGLAFGNGVTAGDKGKLYYTAGPDGEQHGLFGSLTADTSMLAVGASAGNLPEVKVYGLNGELRFDFMAYATSFRGGVHVATGDVNGDGFPDIVTGAGASGGPHLKVFDGRTGNLIREFFAYDASFHGGVNVAVGDINDDSFGDVITGAGAGGGPHAKAFDGQTGAEIRSFFAYDASFTGGVNVAAGDVDGDGNADIITGAGPGGGPHVKVFSGLDNSLMRSFFAYSADFHGGVFVASADFTGDGKADIVTGAGAGGGPHVEVFDGTDLALTQSFYAFGPTFTGGVTVAVTDRNGDGRFDLVTGASATNSPQVRVWIDDDLTRDEDFDAFTSDYTGGVFVG